ncbi:(Fe-S)-binding protein [Idiomarina sp. OT37-5b]|jgi:ferredoxin|uniref:(Fe-S)-binding protein n=1 Tax=Idiomarina aquatica TaxID=1327752 RepID=A0AA94EEH6_9GAMM|nr:MULTISPECIES: class I ribonucleotide reductase maintenance protein YfaE [Idiomarina]AVJ56000.1 (Fe-S)-binding protein [Idiomarina sp. OT37-5b]RUO43470.1 (Fe-S)-binding protein [Idiomarina aquatica]|tara:strand:- start:300 stop:563 length:264 start_codon:yes stop_codon:yes gene_type:complete
MSQTVFKVTVNGEHELTVDASEGTLLEALEAHQLEVHYHCKSGFCGACRSTLKSGSVRYINEPLAYVRKGDILPCCCVPTSDLDLDH